MLKDENCILFSTYSSKNVNLFNLYYDIECVSVKFAAFAIIYLGNMIYDTQLLSNIDACMTDISFNETFIL